MQKPTGNTAWSSFLVALIGGVSISLWENQLELPVCVKTPKTRCLVFQRRGDEGYHHELSTPLTSTWSTNRSCTDKARSQLRFRFDGVFWSSLKLHLTRNVFFVSQTSGTFDYFGLISSENLNTLDLLLVWLNSATRDSEPPSKQKGLV